MEYIVAGAGTYKRWTARPDGALRWCCWPFRWDYAQVVQVRAVPFGARGTGCRETPHAKAGVIAAHLPAWARS